MALQAVLMGPLLGVKKLDIMFGWVAKDWARESQVRHVQVAFHGAV